MCCNCCFKYCCCVRIDKNDVFVHYSPYYSCLHKGGWKYEAKIRWEARARNILIISSAARILERLLTLFIVIAVIRVLEAKTGELESKILIFFMWEIPTWIILIFILCFNIRPTFNRILLPFFLQSGVAFSQITAYCTGFRSDKYHIVCYIEIMTRLLWEVLLLWFICNSLKPSSRSQIVLAENSARLELSLDRRMEHPIERSQQESSPDMRAQGNYPLEPLNLAIEDEIQYPEEDHGSREDNICINCCSKKKDAVFIPCGHANCCHDCAVAWFNASKKCILNCESTGVLKIYT